MDANDRLDRFSAVGPARVLDSRAGNSPDALRYVTKAKIGGSKVLEVKVTPTSSATSLRAA